MWEGRLELIHVAEQGSAPMRPLDEARLISGFGIEGDRYATGRGTYSKKLGPDRQITLIEVETLDALQRDHGIELLPHETRRNLTTRDVPLNHLVGRRFRVGEAVLLGVRLNRPCKYLEDLLDKPVFALLVHRSGLNCEVVEGGVIRRGDTVRPE